MRCLLLCLSVLALTACRPPSAEPRPPESSSPGVSGDVGAQPFTLAAAYASRRADGKINIYAFERDVGERAGCGEPLEAMEDTERYVWIQMAWPEPPGKSWDTAKAAPGAAPSVFFFVRRAVGGAGARVDGTVEVLSAEEASGVLLLDVTTDNGRGGPVHGSVQGEVPFKFCPGAA